MTETTNDSGTSKQISILGQILQSEEMEAYEKKMREFNPFAALRLKDYEIRHTNALAWLLDIEGSHGLKDRFLKSFLSIIARDMDIKNGLGSDNVIVIAEDRFSDNHKGNLGLNRLDIWLEGDDWVIALEAKINSKEGEKQLSNYFDEIKQRLKGGKYKTVNDDKRIFLFLTVDKKMPENKSKSDVYDRWKAVSWLGLVAESLVIAIKDAIANKSLEENSYKHQFLISYLDVIYEKSTKEFERLEVASIENGQNRPSVLFDRDHRDGYLQKVKTLIVGDECFKETLKNLKDQWEAAEKNKQSWEEYCQKLKMALFQTPDPKNQEKNVLANVQDFQSTLQFLLDQVDSTVEGRMRIIKDVINDVTLDNKPVFEILSSSFSRINFIPKAWIGDEPLDRSHQLYRDRLRCLVEYKQTKNEIECKLYFISSKIPNKKNANEKMTYTILDQPYLDWREALWDNLKQNPMKIFGRYEQNNEGAFTSNLKVVDTDFKIGGNLKIINFQTDIDNFMQNMDNFLKKIIQPAIQPVLDAAKVIDPQS